jgi:hypothetical protein
MDRLLEALVELEGAGQMRSEPAEEVRAWLLQVPKAVGNVEAQSQAAPLLPGDHEAGAVSVVARRLQPLVIEDLAFQPVARDGLGGSDDLADSTSSSRVASEKPENPLRVETPATHGIARQRSDPRAGHLELRTPSTISES